MDWYVIEYLYPESYKLFINTMYPNIGIVSMNVLKNFDLKKLYSFFDKQDIFLILELNNLNEWGFSIKTNNWFITDNNIIKNNRDEVESEGFTCCFKFLEAKINLKEKV
jgi:hypothetical protein